MNHPTEPTTAQRAVMDEVRGRLPELWHARTRLRSSGIAPTGVLLPARLDVPYEGPDATDFKATCMGLPVTWAKGEEWGLIVGLPRVTPPASTQDAR